MAEVRPLAKPPIAEAVIAFGLHFPSPLVDESPREKISAAFRQNFPKAHKAQQRHVSLLVVPDERGDPSPQVQNSARFNGWRFEAENGSRVVTYTAEHFGFSFVNNYSGWDQFIQAAKDAWSEMKVVVKPAVVHRIGLRYINKAELKLPADSRDYLCAGPRLPEDLNLDTSNFLSQMEVQLPIQAKAVIVQLLEHRLDGSSVVIDIDVSQDGLTLDPDSTECWERLAAFRDWKNKIFFSHVTEKLLEPYA